MDFNFAIYPSLFEESRESWVWLPKACEGAIKSGDMVKIIYGQQSIVLTGRIIDSYYVKIKRGRLSENEVANFKSTIFLSKHYQDILGLKVTPTFVALKIKKTNQWQDLYWNYFNQHPRAEVRLTFYLAVFSIVLSVIGMLPWNKVYSFLANIC